MPTQLIFFAKATVIALLAYLTIKTIAQSRLYLFVRAHVLGVKLGKKLLKIYHDIEEENKLFAQRQILYFLNKKMASTVHSPYDIEYQEAKTFFVNNL